jgi:putative alpha-1,2-mannosidase
MVTSKAFDPSDDHIYKSTIANLAIMSLSQAPFQNAIELLDPLPKRLYSKMRALGIAALAFSPHASQSYHDNAGVLRYVNPKIGTSGVTPNGNGGMIPSVSPPFSMTRWTPQTRENFISQCPYNDLDSYIHGFQATHQPAIWMGESGQVVIVPGVGEVKPLFKERGHGFRKEDERSTPYVYEVEIGVDAVSTGENLTESLFSPVPGGGQPVPDEVSEGANGRIRRDEQGKVGTVEATRGSHAGSDRHELCEQHEKGDKIKVAMTASSHVGHLRFEFPQSQREPSMEPYVFIQATRQNWTGSIVIDSELQEVSGSNPQRQDYALGPYRAPNFSGYFVSRFSQSFVSHGITHGDATEANTTEGTGEHLGAWVKFDSSCGKVEVRTGVSFVSIEQARKNLDIEAPSSVTFDNAVETLKDAWLEKMDRLRIEGVNETAAEYDQRTIFYSGLFHGLQYPSDFSEPLETIEGGRRTWYEGYTDQVREDEDSYYQSWSIWVSCLDVCSERTYDSLTYYRIHSVQNTAC